MDDDDFISKTRRKRESTELQNIGKELVGLPAEQLARMQLPEDLLGAVLACKPITNHEGRRRQMQYIGKIMRNVDPAPIIAELERIKAPSKRQTALFHLAEKWRDALLAEPEAAARFASEYRETDTAKLRTLIDDARAERNAGKSPKRTRELFHFVNDIVQRHARPA